MAKLPIGDRLSREDFQDVPKEMEPIIDRLLFQLNNFMTTVYDALNANLTAPDNIAATYKTFRIRAGAASSDNTITFTHGLKYRPKGCFVISASRVDGQTILAPIYVTWKLLSDPSLIKIMSVSMLTAGLDYDLTVRVE